MSHTESLKTGDRIEVIDTTHKDFGKQGKVGEILGRALGVLNDPNQPDRMIIVRVVLEGNNQRVDFTDPPKRIHEQIRKVCV